MGVSNLQVRHVINELVHNSRYRFERSCIELLQMIYPNIIDSKVLGHFEKEGIDAYVFDHETEEYDIAFQFKGFEVMKFGESQKKQCIKSINSFSKSTKNFETYFLIVNLPITEKEMRMSIE